MKKTLAILLALVATLSLFTCAFAEEPAAELVAEIEALGEDCDFEPNAEYEEYTYVYYEIEDIAAELYCTVSKKAVDDSTTEFYVETNFYGDDQLVVATYDGTDFEITQDKTGFLKGDAPAILQIAVDNNVWFPIEAA